MAKKVVIASSVTPKDVNDALLSQETTGTYDIPDVVPATERKGGDNCDEEVKDASTC